MDRCSSVSWPGEQYKLMKDTTPGIGIPALHAVVTLSLCLGCCRFLMHLARQLKPMELCGLQKHFHLMDANCNGTIEFEELLTVAMVAMSRQSVLHFHCHLAASCLAVRMQPTLACCTFELCTNYVLHVQTLRTREEHEYDIK